MSCSEFFLYVGVTLSNLLHMFFDSCSANTKKYQCNHHKNKCTHIKAHFFVAPQHMQFTKHYFDLSQKICTGMGAEDQTICQRQTADVLKMKAKYKTKALQKELLKSEIKFLYSDYFYNFLKFSLLSLVKDM